MSSEIVPKTGELPAESVAHVAHRNIVSTMIAFEESGELPAAESEMSSDPSSRKAAFVLTMVDWLQTAARAPRAERPREFGRDPHYEELGIDIISDTFATPRFELDAVQHRRILAYLERHGLPTSDEDREKIRQLADEKAIQSRLATMRSYAEHGLLTFGEGQRRGVIDLTSATPFDTYDLGGAIDIGPDGLVIGYVVDKENVSQRFTGSDAGNRGLYTVAMERPWEKMRDTFDLPTEELANRARNAMLFVVAPSDIPEGVMQGTYLVEQALSESLPPESIKYVVVGGPNVQLAHEVFAGSNIRVLEAPLAEALLLQEESPFHIYDFQGVVGQIVQHEGPMWCHITRLAADAYPEGFERFQPFGRSSF